MFWFDLIEKNVQNKFLLMCFIIFTRSAISVMETCKRVPSPLCTSFLQSCLTRILLLFTASASKSHELSPWETVPWPQCLCLPKIPIVKANDSSDSVRSWDLEWHLGHEGGAYTNGIHAFIKEALWIHSSLSTMWGHSERYTSWKRALAWPCWLPDLRLPGPRIRRGKFLLFFSCPLCDFVVVVVVITAQMY